MKGCPIAGGDLIVDDYGKPLVWIGCYIAAASLLCSAAILADCTYGALHFKPWRTCRFFTLNAATLAVLTVAVKIPVDLNTAMPRSTDQLAKLSGAVFLCIAMGNFLHSLGDSSTVFANVIALAILVITVVVNIIIQISTGVIYIFVVEHVVVIAILILLLIVSISSALAIVVAKEKLEEELDRKIRDPEFSPAQSISLDHLRSCAKKFLLMVRFASPQYVLSRSMISATSVFFCFAATVILFTACMRVRYVRRSLKQCKGTSDYAWSTIGVLVLQGLGAVCGLLSLILRWMNEAIPDKGSWKDVKVDDHWLQLLVSWKGIPPEVEDIMNLNKIFFRIKIAAINCGIYWQKAVVLYMKVGHLLSLFLVCFMGYDSSGDRHLDDYVLRLREENFVPAFIHDVSEEFEWIQAGRHKKALATKNLIERYSTHEQGFTQVCTFLPHLDNCWALPLVTLTAIAATISTSEEGTQSLLRAVGEGLRYVRLVDKHLDDRGMVNSRMAADTVWTDLRIYNKWLGAKLTNDRQTELTLEDLFRIADNKARSSTWDLGLSEKTLAAVCMRDIIARILFYETGDGELFERLRVAIADIMGACLTNLLKALFIGFICCRKEEREKNVRLAVSILGEAEEILTLVHIPDVDKQHIDEWRVPQSS